MSRVAVAGAGLTGSLLAVRLARAGHDVVLFDKRPDLRIDDVDAGRSINLAVSTRGLDALARVPDPGGDPARTLADRILDDAIAMGGRIIHDARGATTYQPYGTETHHRLHSVNRDALNHALLDAVDATDGVEVRFSHRVRDHSVRRRELTFDTPDGRIVEQFDTVFGADGAYSAIRGRLQRIGRVDYSQQFLDHGYKELTIAARADGGHALDPHALHIWPRGGSMMIALPNPDGTFTATLFWPYDGDDDLSFAGVTTAADVRRVFARHLPDAAALMPDHVDEYLANPTSSLVTIRTGPWFHDDDTLVLGDAAHAVVPFYGQGANAALEDVTIVMDLYDELGADAHGAVFARFYAERKPHADALADLAIEHYEEMRSDVRSRWFLTVAALERALHRLLPTRFVPLYTMVSFTRTPYADAVARARRQHRAIAAIAIAAAVLLALMALAVIIFLR